MMKNNFFVYTKALVSPGSHPNICQTLTKSRNSFIHDQDQQTKVTFQAYKKMCLCRTWSFIKKIKNNLFHKDFIDKKEFTHIKRIPAHNK